MPPVAKIKQLPAHIRKALEEAFVKHAFGDIEQITAWLNELLQAEGVQMTIGKSAVGKESQAFREAMETMTLTTRQMKLMAEANPDDADYRGEALNGMVSAGMFTALMDLRKAESEPDPAKRIALLNKAALGSARLTVSSVNQRKWRAEVESKAKAAADAVAKIARTGGLNANQVREIRTQILGIAKRAAPADATPTTNPV